MNTEPNNTKRKRPLKKIILRSLSVFFIILFAGAVILYYNLNRILTNALKKSFDSNVISDIYELKFEKLSVNFLAGNVSVHNVEFRQREIPAGSYPYINSSLRLSTRKMMLKNVEILTLIKSNILKLDKIEISEPDVKFRIEDKIPVFFPIRDTTAAKPAEKNKKRFIEAFVLKEFDLVNASFHTTNLAKEREFRIQYLTISFRDMMIDQQPGKDLLFYKRVHLSIGDFAGNLQKRAIRYIHFKDYHINIDSLQLVQTPDTAIWNFADFSTGLKELDIQTADSLFHLTMQSFDLSYKKKTISLNGLAFKPNVSDARLQARFPYQNTQASGTVGSLNLFGVNFDSLTHKGKIFIDEIILDTATVNLYKDKTKPIDKNHFPEYLGQAVRSFRSPLHIRQLKASNVNLVNKERNPDGSYATAHISRATAELKNITNLSPEGTLALKGDAYLENKAHFNLTLNFSYSKPHFSFSGAIDKFNLPRLNPLIEAYTPASVHKGVLDELTFSGNANRTGSAGNLKFLYHDLDIDIHLEGKAKWKSSVLAFGANAVLPSSNPASADLPPRTVTFQVERDLHKSFVNLTIKSLLNGLKETIIMSKENKKVFRDQKREAKKKKKNNRGR